MMDYCPAQLLRMLREKVIDNKKMMDFLLEMMNFILEMVNFVFKIA